MEFKTLGSVVTRFAPFLGKAIGMGSPLAGALVSMIGIAFGLDEKNIDPNVLISRILNDKEAEIKLKQIEINNQQFLVGEEVEDRKSARDREKKIVEITGTRDWLMEMIAFIVIAGYFIMCALLLFNKINNENNQVLYMMFGQLTGGFIMILSYYFGSSKPKQTTKLN